MFHLPVLQPSDLETSSAPSRIRVNPVTADSSPRERHLRAKFPYMAVTTRMRIPKGEGRAAEAERLAILADYGDSPPARPTTRAECAAHEGPCPWVSCKWHLKFDVTLRGSLRDNFPGREVWDMPHTCALDVADAGPQTLEAVGDVLNLTRERVRQVEQRAVKRLTGRRGQPLRDHAPWVDDARPFVEHGRDTAGDDEPSDEAAE